MRMIAAKMGFEGNGRCKGVFREESLYSVQMGAVGMDLLSILLYGHFREGDCC